MNITRINGRYIPFERVLTILKEVARGELYWDDSDNQYCLFCDYNRWITDRKLHNKTCPVALARAVLREQEMPLYLYTINFEQRFANNSLWRTLTANVPAYTEEEALVEYAEDPDQDDLRNSKRRNIQVVAHREIEDHEAEP